MRGNSKVLEAAGVAVVFCGLIGLSLRPVAQTLVPAARRTSSSGSFEGSTAATPKPPLDSLLQIDTKHRRRALPERPVTEAPGLRSTEPRAEPIGLELHGTASGEDIGVAVVSTESGTMRIVGVGSEVSGLSVRSIDHGSIVVARQRQEATLLVQSARHASEPVVRAVAFTPEFVTFTQERVVITDQNGRLPVVRRATVWFGIPPASSSE